MDLSMQIAAMSMSMQSVQYANQLNIAMLKQSMETQEASVDALLDMASVSLDPSLGHRIDSYA